MISLNDVLKQVMGEPGDMNIGEKYVEVKQIESNFWRNHFLYQIQDLLREDDTVKFDVPNNLYNKSVFDPNNVLEEEVTKRNFFNSIKKRVTSNDEEILNQIYAQECQENREILLPVFAKFRNDTLYLSEFNITDIQLNALTKYLLSPLN